jgi:hypothetical protein
VPGGAAGLQNQSGGRKVPGGFDSLPSPPDNTQQLLTEGEIFVHSTAFMIERQGQHSYCNSDDARKRLAS